MCWVRGRQQGAGAGVLRWGVHTQRGGCTALAVSPAGQPALCGAHHAAPYRPQRLHRAAGRRRGRGGAASDAIDIPHTIAAASFAASEPLLLAAASGELPDAARLQREGSSCTLSRQSLATTASRKLATHQPSEGHQPQGHGNDHGGEPVGAEERVVSMSRRVEVDNAWASTAHELQRPQRPSQSRPQAHLPFFRCTCILPVIPWKKLRARASTLCSLAAR